MSKKHFEALAKALKASHVGNTVSLKWGTRKENAMDREAHGRTSRGKRHGVAISNGLEDPANARLIAAAPEMLEALEEIAKGEGAFSRDPLTHAENTIDNMKEIARAAIAKAKGESK